MKQAITVIAREESYKNLSTFTDIEELNTTVRTYKDVINSTIKRSDLRKRLIALLELLKRHSCKYIGVSMMRKNTIADKMGTSYKTIQRLVGRLASLGMVKQVEMKRQKDMLQTSNAVVILPIIEDTTTDKKAVKTKESNKKATKSPAICPTIKTTPVSLKQNIKDINKRNINDNSNNNDNSVKDADFVAHWVPSRFRTFANYFYSDSKTIQEFWKVVKQCNSIVNYVTGETAFTKEQSTNIGIQAMKEFVMKVKCGTKMNRGIFAYFNGIVNNIMDKAYFDDTLLGE
ncbi:helix-turn-helix domain-containing protein [Bacillus paranthracis]|uniref:helix-turn-helix domain-containing protein n=1 Tax=Bacillus paranthracis TaxID=2026186 RepID=UPI0020B79FD5|nr:helix-turn-helix domain-containing protein [Bacillus paranthracis]